MDDLISRQAAIDALVKWTCLPWELLKTIYPMLCLLETLPSAQPEDWMVCLGVQVWEGVVNDVIH